MIAKLPRHASIEFPGTPEEIAVSTEEDGRKSLQRQHGCCRVRKSGLLESSYIPISYRWFLSKYCMNMYACAAEVFSLVLLIYVTVFFMQLI